MPHMQKSEGMASVAVCHTNTCHCHEAAPKKGAFLKLAEGEKGHVVGTE